MDVKCVNWNNYLRWIGRFKLKEEEMSVLCPIGQLTIDKELAFAGNVFSLGKNMVLTDKAPSLQHQPRSLVGRAPLWLDVTHALVQPWGCRFKSCRGWTFFWSYQMEVNRKTEQDQLYNFARFYHSRTSDKGSKNVFILKMYKVALIFCR